MGFLVTGLPVRMRRYRASLPSFTTAFVRRALRFLTVVDSSTMTRLFSFICKNFVATSAPFLVLIASTFITNQCIEVCGRANSRSCSLKAFV
jgi:hypothetical protein